MKLASTSMFVVLNLSCISNALAFKAGRLETQEEYDRNTAGLRIAGECRSYIGPGISNIKRELQPSLATCDTKCGNMVFEGGTQTGISCEALVDPSNPGLGISKGPDGKQFYTGRCICGPLPLADTIIVDVLMALPKLVEIGCDLVFQAFDTIIEGLDAIKPGIPGLGPDMDAGLAASVKGAKTIAKNGGDYKVFRQWLAESCGVSNYTIHADVLFSPLSSVPDFVIPGSGVVPQKDQKNSDPQRSPVAVPETETSQPSPSPSTALGLPRFATHHVRIQMPGADIQGY